MTTEAKRHRAAKRDRIVLKRLVRQQFTKGQRAHIKKFGTAKEFAIAVWGMIGEISVDEAQAAIQKYNLEFSKL